MTDQSLLQRLNLYQKQRFPVIALFISLIPAALSSGAIASSNPTILQVAVAALAGLLYLFHIRVIDEHRDFAHDNAHHASRPVQTGVVSKAELEKIDKLAMFVLVLFSVYWGSIPFVLVLAMLGYSYLAGAEFFIGEKIRQHFFVYNAVNIIQMLLMQIFIYSVFAPLLSYSPLLLWHFLFTSVGTILFEFLRKIHLPGQDGTGADTYSWHLGFIPAISVAIFLLATNGALFFNLATRLYPGSGTWLLVTAGLVALGALSAITHAIKKQKLTENGMQLFFLLIYAAFNIAIYFLAAH